MGDGSYGLTLGSLPFQQSRAANTILNRMTAITHGYARVNGIRLHYAEAGAGDNLVILLHGFPEFWYSWRHQLEPLGRNFHVIAPDLRGYNLSDKPPRVADYRIDEIVTDVMGLMDHFGVKQAAIVGHDWGAGVAWSIAQKHPERVARLVVMQVPLPAVWTEYVAAAIVTQLVHVLFSNSALSRVVNSATKFSCAREIVSGQRRTQR